MLHSSGTELGGDGERDVAVPGLSTQERGWNSSCPGNPALSSVKQMMFCLSLLQPADTDLGNF